VVKLGGSLLDLDGLVPRLRRWRELQPAGTDVVVVGGGPMADAIRDAYRRHHLGEEDAHWLCVRVLAVTAELLARLLPEAALATRFDELAGPPDAGRLWVFATEQFLRCAEPSLRGPPLPHSWDVTSDSIAARLAEALAAQELVLLKSCLPDPASRREALAESGYTDRYFPRAAAMVPRVRCVDLRDDRFPEIVL
jgi:aspartokinase-like uncharacterized kinase